MKFSDIYSIAAFIASGGLATIVQTLGATFPKQAGTIANVAAILLAISAAVVRIYANKAGAPATAIVANAAVVPASTTVVTSATPVVASNVTAPQAQNGKTA